MEAANTLTYYNITTITAVKSFTVRALEWANFFAATKMPSHMSLARLQYFVI